MHWCKRSYKIALILVAPVLLSCLVQSCKPNLSGNTGTKFFDLKKYFTDESVRLKKLNPLVTKTADYNATTETQKVRISDWKTELGIFMESDINKPAWKTSYRISTSDGITTYAAIDSALKTQYIIIKRQNDKVKLVLIYNHSRTTLFGKVLYETRENLSYIPDSMYRVQKRQYVRTLGFKNYFIRGLIDQR
ncbi:MAG: hypothetical protein JST19_10525 [Bacteroidetes bacterium]|nr:hypothetical protein [Bacteroidota bacterium]